MKGRWFTSTFYKFFFGFLALVGVAFVILIAAGSQVKAPTVDNIAGSQ